MYKKSTTQKPEDIKLIFEIKMSVVSNYQLCDSCEVRLVGDYESYKGNPSLLRSESMQKLSGSQLILVFQGFWSLYLEPTESEHIKITTQKGFQTVKDSDGLSSLTDELVNSELSYFSSMIAKKKLGDIIQSANQKKSNEAKAQKFLDLIKGTTLNNQLHHLANRFFDYPSRQ